MRQTGAGRLAMAPFVFALTLLLLIAVLTSAVIAAGGDAYKKIADGMDDNYSRRTPLSYLATKIRQNDETEDIYADSPNGIPAIAIKKSYGGEEDVTYLYFYDGYIREIFLKLKNGAPQDFSPGYGAAVVPADAFEFDVGTDYVDLTVTDTGGREQSLKLALRSGDLRRSRHYYINNEI